MALHEKIQNGVGLIGVGVVIYGALAVATALVCWLGGLRTWPDFGSGLIVVGSIALMVGVLSGKEIADVRSQLQAHGGSEGKTGQIRDWFPGSSIYLGRGSVDCRDLRVAHRLLYVVSMAGMLSVASGLLIRGI